MYYFLAASLPDIRLGEEPEVSFSELLQLMHDNLSKSDLNQVDIVRRLIDLDNIRQVLKEEPLNPLGSWSQKEIEEALLSKTLFPEYVFDILGVSDDREEQIRRFSEVFFCFFREEANLEKGFLKRYFQFERALRLCLLAHRANLLGRDLNKELEGADRTDFLVRALPEFPFELRDLGDRLVAAGDDPWEQYTALARYRFEKLEELGGTSPFTLPFLLSYLLRLMMAEEWYHLSGEEGENRLESIIHSRTSA